MVLGGEGGGSSGYVLDFLCFIVVPWHGVVLQEYMRGDTAEMPSAS